MRYSILQFAIASISLALLTGCSSGLDGTYSAEAGLSTVVYEFEPDGTVYVSGSTLFGDASTTELKYEIDDEKLKIIAPNGENQIFTIKDDGSIDAGMVTLRRNVSGDTEKSESVKTVKEISQPIPGQFLLGKWEVDIDSFSLGSTTTVKQLKESMRAKNGKWFMGFSENSVSNNIISDDGANDEQFIVKEYQQAGNAVVISLDNQEELKITKLSEDRIRIGTKNDVTQDYYELIRVK